jgi:hypothetical protein
MLCLIEAELNLQVAGVKRGRIQVPKDGNLESCYLRKYWEAEHGAGQPIHWLPACVPIIELDASEIDPVLLERTEARAGHTFRVPKNWPRATDADLTAI